MNKRLDAVVSILKNAEETQLKPTREMLESLFKVSDEKPLLLERKDFFETNPVQEDKELIYYKDQYLKQQNEMNIAKNKLKKIFER